MRSIELRSSVGGSSVLAHVRVTKARSQKIQMLPSYVGEEASRMIYLLSESTCVVPKTARRSVLSLWLICKDSGITKRVYVQYRGFR